jgi:methanogenic corrinoid protein MtbC1
VSLVTEGLAGVRARHLELLLRGDRHTVLREAAQLLERGIALEDFVLDVLSPLQAEIGQRWQDGKVSTADERAATEIAEILLTMAAARRRPSTDGARLVMCVADREHHNLPARMIAELLRDQGHAVTFLGSPRPQAGLEALLRQLQPDAVVLSCSLTMNLPGAVALAATAHDAGVPVVGGGTAFGGRPARAGRLGVDGLALRVAEVHDRVAAAARGPLTPPPGDERAEQHAELVAAREPLVAELADRLLWKALPLIPHPLRSARPLRGYVGDFMRFVEAAVLTDEHVLTDYVRWLSARLTTLRAEPELVPTLLTLTRDRLVIDLPAAGDVVDAALVSRTA